MRPRGRGDDFEDDDDDDEFEDVSPPRTTPEPEPEPEPEAEADPEPAPPAPQPARPHLSSLVVRLPPQENGGSSPPPSAGRPARSSSPQGGGPRRGSPPPRRRREFSPPAPRGWDRRRSPPPPERRRPASPPPPRRRYSPPRFQPPRHPRFHDQPQGYGMHPGPSPPRLRREASSYDDAVGPHYPRGYQGGGRGGRFRKGSPPYGRGGRSYGRGHPGKDFINIDGEYVHRNDPNLSPREGDWICQNPNCGNLNFARRTHCNNCNKYRYAPEVYEPRRSPRRVYLSPPPRGPARSPPPRGPARIGGPPVERAPLRETAGYRSPPRVWGIGDRGYASRSPPADRAGRFAEPPLKERMVFRGDRDPRDRAKFDWSVTDGYNQRERPRDGMYLDRSRRRSGSPRDNWGSDLRDRSRSPRNRLMKSSFAGRGPPDDYTDPYMSRGRPNNLETGRGRGRGYRPGGGPYPGEGRGDRHAAPHARNDDGY
ncbi:hypothetical protein QOZ80_6BG0484650 [Eleusine coracana subsp. coracana]|nr:hypothetical protein QOZ80_6BG0484650 [Eleusine coracana subsp. coracana]